MALLTTRAAAWTSLVGTAILTIVLISPVPDHLAMAIGYTGNVRMFALDFRPHLPSEIRDTLEAYQDKGRMAMIVNHIAFDFFFPAAYALLLYNIMARIRRCAQTETSATLLSLPWAAFAADYLENGGFILSAHWYSSEVTLLVWVTAMATALKFAALTAAVLVAFHGAFAENA